MSLPPRHHAGAALLVLATLCGPAWSDALPGADFAQAMGAVRAGQAAQAVAIFATLAEAGDAAAQLNLAVLTARGEGVPQHDADAAYWAWRARLGGLAAAVRPSEILTGRLSPEAVETLAARLAGDLEAMAATGAVAAFLGLARVELALAADPDVARAYAHAALAAAQGVPGAAALRDVLSADLDPQARAAAQTEAARIFETWCSAAGTRSGCPAR